MADDLSDIRRSPLAGLDLGSRAGGAGGVLLSEGAARESFILRGQADDAAFTRAVEAALGIGLPQEPGAAIGSDVLLIRLGPDEWRFIVPLADGGQFAARLSSELARTGGPGALVNVSSATTVIAVAGERATDLLATGTGIDFDPAAFPPGQSVRTRVGNTQALIHRQAVDAFELHVPRSHARSFWEWLEDRGREFHAAIAL